MMLDTQVGPDPRDAMRKRARIKKIQELEEQRRTIINGLTLVNIQKQAYENELERVEQQLANIAL